MNSSTKDCSIELRQSYVRKGKQALVMYGRYAHARQYKRARKQLRKLKMYLGRVRRDIERKLQPEFTALAETPLGS